jgi:hypothetical protein
VVSIPSTSIGVSLSNLNPYLNLALSPKTTLP